MSRFADPKLTDRLSLGACQCPGAPHDEDWIDFRTEFTAADVARTARGDSVDAITGLAVAWNLLDDDGRVAPIDRDHVGRLYADVVNSFNAWTEAHLRLEALPNASAAPSPSSSRESGSRPPTLKKVG